MSYEDLSKIQQEDVDILVTQIPKKMISALIERLVTTAYEKGVYLPGGASKAVKWIEQQLNKRG